MPDKLPNNINDLPFYKLIMYWSNIEKRIYKLKKLGLSSSRKPLKNYLARATKLKKKILQKNREQYSDIIEKEKNRKYQEEIKK